MKPKDFHLALTDIIDLIEVFPKTLWVMFVTPKAGFQAALNSGATPKILPGVFLFVNLFIADLIASPFLSLQSLREFPSHVIGTLIFLFILKLLFREVQTTKLFTIICLSSTVYIPFAITEVVAGVMAGPSCLNYWTFVLSRNYQTVSQLFAPLITLGYKLVPVLSVLMIILLWWVWLLFIGCSQIVDLPIKKRICKLSLSVSGYIMIFVAALIAVAGSTVYSQIRGISDYEEMRVSFENGNYAEAFVLASRVSNNEKLPSVARYRAYVTVAVAQFKMFWKDDDTFRDAIVAINAKKYRAAELRLRKDIEERLVVLDNPMRSLLKNVEAALDKAAKQYTSADYSEGPTNIGFMVFFGDIPISLFPKS